jgi:hypothetical protein
LKNPVPPAAPGSAGDPADAQEVDLDDADVSAEPAPIAARVTAPPPLPPMPAGDVSPVSHPPVSHHPSAPPVGPSFAPMPPQPRGRGPMFYVGILAAVLLASVAAGTVIALTRTKAAPPKPVAGAASGPRVITIPVVDMDDPVDGGP